MEEIIEFHDSRISSIEERKNNLCIFFSHAYIYAKGSGWSQKAKLLIRSGKLIDQPSSYPVSISEGELNMPAMKYYDLLALPFSEKGECEINLILTNGEKIVATGYDPVVELIGEREFLESVEQP
ncbi:MAG: hypothetical protein RPU15_16655 [Candidatus Sedimenticola sp. (ex Thyasira tokunagai)]